MATPVIEPSPQAPAAPPDAVTPQTMQPTPEAPPEAPEPPQGGLPPDLIKIPALQALLAGAPPAVSMKLKGSEDRDEVKMLAEHKDELLKAGFAFYRSMSGDLGVMFNALRIHPQDLQAADKQGKLRALAPDYDLVNHEVAKMGLRHPIHSATAPTGLATPTSTTPPQAASGALPLTPPPAAAVQRKLAQARIMNLQPGAPTSGPEPGGGRLLNQVLRGVV